MLMEDLIYLKEAKMLYKYIVYRPNKKVHILEPLIKNYNKIKYEEFTNKYLDENVISDIDEIIKTIDNKLIELNDCIKELKDSEMDYEELNEKIELLNYELYNLKEIEDPSDNQLKAIANLEKAVRRHKKKIKGAENKYKDNKNNEIYKCNVEIENFKDLLKIAKKYKKKELEES